MTTNATKAYDSIARVNLVNACHLRSSISISLISALLIARFVLDIEFQIALSLTPLIVLLCLNAGYYLQLNRSSAHQRNVLSTQILLDIALLSASFYFSGGPSNPFISFYLVPLTISATLLRQSFTWLVTAITFTCYTALLLYAPQPEDLQMTHNHSSLPSFNAHLVGMWINFCFSAGLIAFFITRLNLEIIKKDASIANYREKVIQGEQVLGLATLATGVAHEISTPLSTIAIAVSDMLEETSSPATQTDLKLIESQIAECKSILGQLTAEAGQGKQSYQRPLKTVHDYLLHLLDRLSILRPQSTAQLTAAGDLPKSMSKQLISPPITVDQALINLINNAFDSSPDAVKIQYSLIDGMIEVHITDDGDGIDSDVLEHLGKPFNTSGKKDGLGLGLFLAHTTFDQLGGSLSLHTRAKKGTLTRVILPLASIS
ncbi:hypothetical protein A9Q99_05405 [Gammaproteobacteria bacterium 45_16_T64]|nr:hypothetical protein A9Q99_05405 [Gammaproteobacteria bacterium 45_16_T64]